MIFVACLHKEVSCRRCQQSDKESALKSKSRPPESDPESESEPDLGAVDEAERRRRYISSRFNLPPDENPNRDQAGVCTMAIETDPILWRYVRDMVSGCTD